MSKNKIALNPTEIEILQILVAQHKYIIYNDEYGWMIDMIIKDEIVNYFYLNHEFVTSLRRKNLLKRIFNDQGKSVYVVNLKNKKYEDFLNELRVRKALGVPEKSKPNGLRVRRLR